MLMTSIKSVIQKFVGCLGYKIIRLSPTTPPESSKQLSVVEKNLYFVDKHRVWNCEQPLDIVFPREINDKEKDIIKYVAANQLTMVSYERMFATVMACKYVVERGIEGDFVECGVWRGGNAILAAYIFSLYQQKRKIWLFDSFNGTFETNDDEYFYVDGKTCKSLFQFREKRPDGGSSIAYASLEEVKTNFSKAGLLNDNIVFVQGDVRQTLDLNIPEKISVLRLDTDWYESTKKELCVLYPKLSRQGILIIDDYGAWSGSKKATDEYFTNIRRPFFHYTDWTGRMGVKE
jgi:hypothetical protein